MLSPSKSYFSRKKGLKKISKTPNLRHFWIR